MTKKMVEYGTKTVPALGREQIERLKQIFPECVSEGQVDFDLLRATLGDADALADENAYTFTWAGKQDAFRAIQTPSGASLAPAPEESVDWDETRHLFIEGENLEVLKLLYKSYFGQVKMIYIDPPYNTGSDFIYRDDYSEPRRAYLEKTGQMDAEGNVLTSNPETRGRYHSDWLNMMYPRLFLARQLLREDGVIFVSIDDNEVHNLRLLMNEIYGEDNFLAQLIWEKTRKNDARFFSVGHDYMVVYARNQSYLRDTDTYWREEKPGAQEIQEEYLRLRKIHGSDNEAIELALGEFYRQLPKGHPAKKHSRYSNVDDRGVWRDHDMSWPGGGGPTYEIIHPKTNQPCAIPEGGWRYATKETMLDMIEKGKVVFREDHTEPPIRKTYLVRSVGPGDIDDLEEDENDIGVQVMGTYFYRSALRASRNLVDLFGSKVFDNPKDHEIIARIIRYTTGTNDLILDFFAGSATTAQAIFDLNRAESSDRRFILVQLPEPVDKTESSGQNASKMGLETIAEIGKERIRRVIKQMKAEGEGQLPVETRETPEDLGFKVFKLAPSRKTTPRRWGSNWPSLIAGWRRASNRCTSSTR